VLSLLVLGLLVSPACFARALAGARVFEIKVEASVGALVDLAAWVAGDSPG